MDLRRTSTLLAAAGGALLVVGACVAVFAPLGSETTASFGDGSTGDEVTRRVSLWDSQHEPAVGVLVGALAIVLVAVLLVRYGGPVGRALVVVVCGLTFVATLLSVGIFVMPGLALLGAGAVVGEAARLERRQLRRLPSPPPVA